MSFNMQFKSVMTVKNQRFFRIDAGRANSGDITYSQHLNGGAGM
jgi:hypothetical protein